MAWLRSVAAVAVLEGADVGEQDAAGGAGGQVDLGADRVGDAGHLR